MRRRPHVSKLTVTKGIKPGEPLETTLTLTSWSKTPVNAITLTLTGAEKYQDAARDVTRVRRPIVNLVATLMGEGELDVGPRTFRARFNMPEHALATYKGRYLRVEYTLFLHVDIPWWPDLTRTYHVDVEPRAQGRPTPKPVAHTTERGGAEPFAEITLDDVVFAPGDVVSGAFALGNLRGREVQAIEMAVVAVERVTPQWTAPSDRYVVYLDPDAVEEGRAQRFQFTLHTWVPPSFDSLSYYFQMKVKIRRGAELTHRIPIAIARLDGPSLVGASQRQPELGSGRWRKIWARAGAPLGLALAGKDLRLTGRAGRAAIDVFVDPSADEASLVAELRYGPWGADLRVRPRQRLSPQRIFPFLVADEQSAAFWSRYKAEGREEAQLRAILTPALLQALMGFDAVQMGDDEVRAVTKSAGYDRQYIGPFLERVAALARAIDIAGERIPPPAAMSSMLPAWRALADELSGELVPGSMAIRGGRLDEARFEIETIFDDEPTPQRTRVAHLVDPPLSPEVEGAPIEGVLAGAPPGTRAIYDEVAKGAREVQLLRSAIEVTLEAPLADPGAERGRMRAMLALARRLRGDKGAGPYR